MISAPSSASGREPRPTLRMVAEAAEVSAMTVSRVLRSHPQVSARTRQRVRKAAAALGYRPDPAVAKLMAYLRGRRKPGFQASICALTDMPPGAHHPYCDAILSGACRRAEQTGYGFNVLHFGRGQSPRSLQRILRSRGVEGLLLLPMTAPVRLDRLLNWREFSVVSATSSVLFPEFHQVVPRHFGNTLDLCRQLARLGYRRIGLALDAAQDSRVNHAFSAAVTWHGRFEAGDSITPFVYDGSPSGLATWFEREKPDVVVLGWQGLLGAFANILGPRVSGRIGFASTDTLPGSGIAGIDELPGEIGAIAVDTLSGLIQRGEKGAPGVTTSITVSGRWVAGRSTPRLRRR